MLADFFSDKRTFLVNHCVYIKAASFVAFHAEIVGGEMGLADPDEDIVEVKWVDIAAANEIFANLSVKMTINADSRFAGYSFHGKV